MSTPHLRVLFRALRPNIRLYIPFTYMIYLYSLYSIYHVYIYPPCLAVSAAPCPDWAVDPRAWASRRCPAPTAAPRPPPRQAAWAASRVVAPAAAAACPAWSPRGSQAGGPCRLQDLKAIPSIAFQVPNYRSPPLNTAINPLKTMKGDDFPCSKPSIFRVSS